MDILEGGKPDPADWGTIDAVTHGRGMDTFVGIPEAGVGVQGSAYQMTGWRNFKTGHEAPSNAFSATLTNLKEATLDLARMGISNAQPIHATLNTDGPVTVTLAGTWNAPPELSGCTGCGVVIDGEGLHLTFATNLDLTIVPAWAGAACATLIGER